MKFRNPFAATKPGPNSARRRPSATRLAVTTLEDRSVPATLSIGDVGVWEGVSGSQNATAVVRLSQPSNRTVTVDYYTRSDIFPWATAGSDYTAVSGRLTFAPGETQKSILVPIHGDRVAEGNEGFSVYLSRPRQATIADGRGVITIGDSSPRVSVWGGWASEADGYAYFTVYLSSAYDRPVTVEYGTADGSAVAGQDYVATSGTVTFAPGETTKTIAIPLIADTTPEADEVFHLHLGNTSYAVFDWDNSWNETWIVAD
jgi:chitinase